MAFDHWNLYFPSSPGGKQRQAIKGSPVLHSHQHRAIQDNADSSPGLKQRQVSRNCKCSKPKNFPYVWKWTLPTQESGLKPSALHHSSLSAVKVFLKSNLLLLTHAFFLTAQFKYLFSLWFPVTSLVPEECCSDRAAKAEGEPDDPVQKPQTLFPGLFGLSR